MNEDTFPKHKASLHLTHNQHKAFYMSAEQYVFESNQSGALWKDKDATLRAIANDEIWELQWYPDTPVTFLRVCAPTLDEVLALAKERE